MSTSKYILMLHVQRGDGAELEQLKTMLTEAVKATPHFNLELLEVCGIPQPGSKTREGRGVE